MRIANSSAFTRRPPSRKSAAGADPVDDCRQWQQAELAFRKVIELDPRSAAAYSALGIVEHYQGHYQEAIARYHEVRNSFDLALVGWKRIDPQNVDVQPVAPPLLSQALAITPGDPVACDLLKLALDDVAAQITSRKFPFPGLPPRTLRNIDEQVAALDADILAGVPLPGEEDVGEGEVDDEEEEEDSLAYEGELSIAGSSAVGMQTTQSEEGAYDMSLEGDAVEDLDVTEGETMDMTGDDG